MKKTSKKTEEFYGDVIVNVKKRLRVAAIIPSGLTGQKLNNAILKILQNEEHDDITDEETLEYIEVLEVDGDTGELFD
jgi:hypothetical protein